MKNKIKRIAVVIALSMLTTNAGAFATNITGVEGINGIYEILPTLIKGKTGFRHYNKFELSNGDTANLIYDKDGNPINTFVNMVDGKVNINGLLRAVGPDGSLNNGKAVFISPNGMVIGSSGVVRVGSLSVYTPTEEQYNRYKSNPNTAFSKVDKNNADISIYGKIIAKDAVTLSGRNVRMINGSAIYAGVNDTTSSNADLFNQLVSSSVKDSNSFATQDGKVYIKTSSNETVLPDGPESGTYFSGTIKNFARNGSVDINTNNLSGAFVGGTINSAKDINMKNTKGALEIDSPANIDNNGKLTITNSGQGGLRFSGNITNNNTSNTKNSITITNTKGDLNMSGNINTKNTNISITANNGNLNYMGKINNIGTLRMVHNGSGNMNLLNVGYRSDMPNESISKLSNHGTTTITNYSGNMNADVDMENHGKTTLTNYGDNMNIGLGQTITYGSTNIVNNGTGNLEINNRDFQGGTVYVNNNKNAGAMKINNETYFVDNSKLTLINNSKNGMDYKGHIVNYNDTNKKNYVTLYNNNGNLNFDGTINTKTTDVTISSNGNFDFDGEINNSGKLNISHKGAGDLSLYGEYDIIHQVEKEKESRISNAGTTTITNDSGNLYIDGYLQNRSGNMNITNNGNKLAIGGSLNNNTIDNGGNLKITNNGNDGMQIEYMDINGGNVNITNNKGAAIIKDGGNFRDNNKLTITNNGQNEEGGGLYFQCNVINNNTSDVKRKITIKNNKGALHTASTFDTKNTDIDITNNSNNGFFYIGKVNNTGNLTIKDNGNGDFSLFSINHYTGDPLFRDLSNIQNSGNTTISNKGGNLYMFSDIENSNGKLNIINTGNNMYISGEPNDILTISNSGNINITNSGTGMLGMYYTDINTSRGNINISNENNALNMYAVGITNTDRNVNITNRGENGLNMYYPNVNAKGNINIYNYSETPADIVKQSNSDNPIQSTNGNVTMQDIDPITGERTNITIRSDE